MLSQINSKEQFMEWIIGIWLFLGAAKYANRKTNFNPGLLPAWMTTEPPGVKKFLLFLVYAFTWPLQK